MTPIAQIEEESLLYKDLSYRVIGLAMQVHNELGFGFLEKVYENALMVLFEENGIYAMNQVAIQIPFHGRIVGEYCADIVVENSIVLELKALDRIAEIHKAQTLNYLKATSFRLALLINFGKHMLEYKRLVL
jgi:GxxExxY protein